MDYNCIRVENIRAAEYTRKFECVILEYYLELSKNLSEKYCIYEGSFTKGNIISENLGEYDNGKHSERYDKSALAKDIERMEKVGFDEACKRILSNVEIAARIMKVCIEEYSGMDIGDIAANYIRDGQNISKYAVHREDMSDEVIQGLNVEDMSGKEGKVLYDIRFKGLVSKPHSFSDMLINIEGQADYRPGYPIIKRALYYCARMLSAQKGVEFKGDDYDKIRKVVSIWVCTDVPAYMQNTITIYSIDKKNKFGNPKEEISNYDLILAVMICLGRSEDIKEAESDIIADNAEGRNDYKECAELLKLLDIIFVDKLDCDEKIRLISKEFGINMTAEFEREVRNMCNISEAIFRRGAREGMKQGMEQGQDRFAELVKRLILDNKIADIEIVANDKKYRDKLYIKYGL